MFQNNFKLLNKLSSIPLSHRLSGLRRCFPSGLDAYIVPTNDAHGNQYIGNCDKRREFISGFTGSFGDAVITQHSAILFTDSRYTLQAEGQLDPAIWTIQNITNQSIKSWLQSNATHSKVGVASDIISYANFSSYSSSLKRYGIDFVAMSDNLIDSIWLDRPARWNQPLSALPISFTGLSVASKVNMLREAMLQEHCQALVISDLDEVAWLLNLRGNDIPFNPLFYSYVILTLQEEGLHWFVDSSKLTHNAHIHQHLTDNAISIKLHNYEDVMQYLYELSHSNANVASVWFSFNATHQLVNQVKQEQRLVAFSPVSSLKCQKTSSEVNGIRRAHLQDAVAVCRYLHYLQTHVDCEKITELSGADKLLEFRSAEADFVSCSFNTISAFREHGAVIHYAANPETASLITRDGLYLIDSGGQYTCGTTDVTRTIHLGQPTQEEKKLFTLVLKGHIHLAALVFPSGTKGSLLSAQARLPLWKEGYNYQHGTGHGVGAFLNVHEGPIGFSSAPPRNEMGLRENHIITIEPGYYQPGEFGIRIENIVVVTNESFPDGGQLPAGFLRFEPLTFVPIQQNLILTSLLTAEEVHWVNAYHAKCREILTSLLLERNCFDVCEWIVESTKPIE